MSDSPIQFNRQEIGRLTMQLQSYCRSCAHGREGFYCSINAACPVGISRKVLANYLADSQPLLKDFDFHKIPRKPADVAFDVEKMNKTILTVHDLCNLCMFHADKCFINIVYALLESALEVPKPKSPAVKPGEDLL